MSDVISLAEKLKKQFPQKLPPVHLWNPPLSGDMDMRIAADGKWFHEGNEIKRHALVKLFSSILKKENDEYFLVTPVEKWRIKVDCVPFVIVQCDVLNQESLIDELSNDLESKASSIICLTTNTEDKVLVDKDHPIWVENSKEGRSKGQTDKTGSEELLPYVVVRDDLYGLINRNIYYQLVDMALEDHGEVKAAQEGGEVFIRSGGEKFSLNPKASPNA